MASFNNPSSKRNNLIKTTRNDQFYIPEELLITHILTRLPIKPVLRFKSVSKKFNSIISSSYFAKIHFIESNSSDNNTHLLINHATCFVSFDFDFFRGRIISDCSLFDNKGDIIDNKSGSARIISSKFTFPHCHIFVIGSYNGLVCFKTKYFLYVWNPTTLVCREIPLLGRFFEKEDWVWGFGCVTSGRDDYKIIRVCQSKENNEKIIEIFSLLENRWTVSYQKTDEGFGGKPKLSGLGVSRNNVTYWLYVAFNNEDTLQNMKSLWWIIGFDLVTCKLKRVPLPDWLTSGFKNAPMMYVMGGQLCAGWEINDGCVVEVGSLKEDGATSTWIKLYRLSHDVVLHYMKYGNKDVPVITTNNNNRFGVMDRRNQDTILFIDPAQESHDEDVLKLRIPCSKNVFNYIESLISPFL